MASGLENIETVESPFRRFVTTIGVFPTAFTDAMTYYECLAYLVKYMEDTMIPAINENAEAVKELQELYIQLKSFVDNYFENLDVQEEINNKLDAMVEAGTLQEIITSYIQANVAWCFDTVAAMKSSTNLINGSFAQTLGYHSKNDGGAAIYKIRTITNDDVVDEATIIELADDSLIAELIVEDTIKLEQFGAYGDGTHDDTAAVNKAIAYSNNTYKCIKATKKYYITSSINAETLTNGYINIDGETPVHSYMQSGIYGYDIGGSFIVNNIPLIAGNKTKVLRGSIRNLTIIPVTRDSSTDVFYKVKFSGFHFNNLSVFYFKNFLDDCLCNASSRIENCVIQFIESLIYAESFVESAIQNNYITGLSDKGSSCFNTYLFGTKVENNFIEYFDYIYNDQRANRVTAEFISHGNTYDFFGTMFGLKTNSDPLAYVGLISTQDTFSNWRGANAILLPVTNMKVIIKSPIVKPASGNLSFISCSGNLYATDATFLWLDNIQSIVTYKPTINITFWSTNQQNRRIYVENLDYISVESLPSFGFIGQHVIYNDSLYCYIKSGSWKKISDQA